MPPLVGWAAATGGLTLEALVPFTIIFLWTPPHFWALALLISDDYERTGVPMLPVVRGAEFTRRRILAYSVVLVAFTLLPVATGMFGALYLAAAVLLGAGFLALAADPPARAVEAGRPAPLPELPRLPLRPLRRHGGRPADRLRPTRARDRHLGDNRTMDRVRANNSIRLGIGAAALALFVFALTFYAAILYIG